MILSIVSWFFYLLLLKAETQFHLYYTHFVNDNNWYYDCLYNKVLDPVEKPENVKTNTPFPYQTIQYCIRPRENLNQDYRRLMNGSVLSVLTFEELRKQHVTSSDLLSWSAPIDLLERYQHYIETSHSSLNSEEFYNCTTAWFGAFCQYTFHLNATFGKIVQETFKAKATRDCDSRLILPGITNLTCYEHLTCNRGPTPMCLDWHEICDGQIHCLGSGIDEINCFELETHECDNNQYRCHNGMCIPEEFFDDESFYPDCLDVSDERFYSELPKTCWGFHTCVHDPTFRCEDVNYPIDFLIVTRDRQPSDAVFTLPRNKEEYMAMLYTLDNRRHMTFDQSVLLDNKHTNLTYECWLLMSCLTFGRFTDRCDILCNRTFCYLRIQSQCNTSTYVIFPSMPVFHGHVLFGYWTKTTVAYRGASRAMIRPDFLCYDVQLCPFFSSSFTLDNYTCLESRKNGLTTWVNIRRSFHQCLTIDPSGNETHCFHPSLFHCPRTSKCISKHRLLDGISDCYQNIDETYTNSCQLNDKYRFHCSSENKCISRILVGNNVNDCSGKEDEIVPMYNKLFYENLCNGYVHYLPMLVNEQNETDETNCEHWPCKNQYTRCDGAWTCLNGADELGCNPLSKCYPNAHECVSPVTFDIRCLPLKQTNDGKMDCLGGTDEREYCRQLYPEYFFSRYRCWNESRCHLNACQGPKACFFEKDTGFEQVCNTNANIKGVLDNVDMDKYLKSMTVDQGDRYRFPRYKYFSVYSSNSFPFKSAYASLTNMDKIVEKSSEHASDQNTQLSVRQNEPGALNKKIDFRRAWICNRGILVYVGREYDEHCLCPPSYYGDRCQFQSQRVSLTIKFRQECAPNCHEIYAIVLTLIDQNRMIYSSEQLTYIPTSKNCTMKYNIYFLYGLRPKDRTKNYAIDIHAYKKSELTYYTSWTLPVEFSFLPVNRMAALLILPSYATNVFNNCTLECGNYGHCTVYANNKSPFCRCDRGWSGVQCTIENMNCDCSSDSLCLGIVNDRSICLCPLHKLGPRCFLHAMCQNNTCENDGQCIPEDDRSSFNVLKCICPPGFSGETCEIKNTQIDFSFDDAEIPQSLLLYFVIV